MSYPGDFDLSGTTATQISRLISMVEATAKRSVVGKVLERIRTRMCLHCDGTQAKRGLCEKHYSQFRRGLLEKPRKERIKFEAQQIKEGRILSSGQVREIVGAESNPFVMD